MKYFRVIEDGQAYNNGKYLPLVKNELFTHREVQKYGIHHSKLAPVEVSKRKTYFCFGARFEGETTERLY